LDLEKRLPLLLHASEKLAGKPIKLCSNMCSIFFISTSGTIHISYAHVHRQPLEEPLDVFHSRQLSYPVVITVYDMLECHGMDIIPFPSRGIPHHYDESVQNTTVARRSILHVGDERGWCLFSIEVRNTYGLPFEVTFDRMQEGLPTIPEGLCLLNVHFRNSTGVNVLHRSARIDDAVSLVLMEIVSAVNG
jgi:Transport protein Trs120 or TRAPPC9, TRAPP II complex subunit